MRELRDELAEYAGSDLLERETTAAFLAFLAAHEDAFERRLAVGHVTGSAWVVELGVGKWLQFGGHADGERDIRAVALREAREESGIEALHFAIPGIYDVDIHAIPARGDEPEHLHYDVRWIALDQLASFSIDDSLRRLAAKTLGLPLCKDSV